MTRVKICGITSADAIDTAVAAGVDYVGLVFYAKSPRHLDLERASSLSKHIGGRAMTVALVVDADDTLLDQIVARVNPDILQLHGDETPQRVAQIKKQYARPVWKAVAVSSHDDVASTRPFVEADALILFDAKPPDDPTALPGGNGLRFDWHILNDAHISTEAGRRPFALAGGLTPDNVAAAVKLVDPAIVDVSSGVESAPGVKDLSLIESFIRRAKTAKQVSK